MNHTCIWVGGHAIALVGGHDFWVGGHDLRRAGRSTCAAPAALTRACAIAGASRPRVMSMLYALYQLLRHEREGLGLDAAARTPLPAPALAVADRTRQPWMKPAVRGAAATGPHSRRPPLRVVPPALVDRARQARRLLPALRLHPPKRDGAAARCSKCRNRRISEVRDWRVACLFYPPPAQGEGSAVRRRVSGCHLRRESIL
jgi:hypothetical protein